MLQDLRYAVRLLRRSPGFAAAAILTLALGVGANVAIFSVLEVVLLRALPYPHPEQLVVLDGAGFRFANPTLDIQRDVLQSRSLSDAALYSVGSVNLAGGQTPERVQAAQVSHGFFGVMGVAPALGRPIALSDTLENPPSAAVISHGLWHRRFGAASTAIGSPLVLNGRGYIVIGIMPPGFAFPERTDAWIPAALRDNPFMTTMVFQYVGRLAPGVALHSAQAEMDVLGQAEAARAARAGLRPVSVKPLHGELVRQIRPTLVLLGGAVAFVLFIACVNVANLLLARATARSAEITVRASLGASRGRLVRQLLVEHSLIAAIAGGLGLLVGGGLLRLLAARIPSDVALVEHVGIDAQVALFAFGLSGLTVVLFGLVPAVKASRVDLQSALRSSGSAVPAGHTRASNVLVVVEVALALVLLSGAGLLARSFARVVAVDTGFSRDQVLTFELSLTKPRYASREHYADFFVRLRERLRALPGVVAVGSVQNLPLSGSVGMGGAVELEGRPEWKLPLNAFVAHRVAGPGYFDALQIPLLSGHTFRDADTSDTPAVAVINRSFAALAWGGASPLGARLRFNFGPQKGRWIEIVGVVSDVRYGGPELGSSPEAYVSAMQEPRPVMTVAVRTLRSAHDLTAPVRTILQTLDPDLPIYNIKTMSEWYDAKLANRRFAVQLLGLFAIAAVTLAAVGIFSVMSYLVGLRAREIGLRIALGAHPSSVRRLVLRRAATLTVIGTLIGLAAALALSRVIRGFLFQTEPTDPATLISVAVLLGAVAIGASYLPARRASRIDPIQALKVE